MSDFEIGISRSKDTISEPSRRAEHDGAILIFASLLSKNLLMENHFRKNGNFLFHDLWSQNY